MVGRFVQVEKVRLPQEGPGQEDAGFLAAGEFVGTAGKICVPEAQTKGDLPDAGFVVVAGELLKAEEDPLVFRQQLLPGQAVLIADGVISLMMEAGFQLGFFASRRRTSAKAARKSS